MEHSANQSWLVEPIHPKENVMQSVFILIMGLVNGFVIGAYLRTPARERNDWILLPLTISLAIAVIAALSHG
jgi:hypothetical protein